MLKKFSHYSAEYLIEHKQIDADMTELYEYGFQLLYSTTLGVLSITLISALFLSA